MELNVTRGCHCLLKGIRTAWTLPTTSMSLIRRAANGDTVRLRKTRNT